MTPGEVADALERGEPVRLEQDEAVRLANETAGETGIPATARPAADGWRIVDARWVTWA